VFMITYRRDKNASTVHVIYITLNTLFFVVKTLFILPIRSLFHNRSTDSP